MGFLWDFNGILIGIFIFHEEKNSHLWGKKKAKNEIKINEKCPKNGDFNGNFNGNLMGIFMGILMGF